MSTLKVTNIESPSGGGVNAKITDINGGQLSNRNLIINGEQKVDQRNSGSSVTLSSTAAFATDRWSAKINGGAATAEQDTTVPSGKGFTKSLKFDVTTADTSLGANDEIFVQTKIEAQDLTQLSHGTSDAQSVTFSFWVKSALTGNYGLYVQKPDSGRAYQTTYNISAANTWEYKTITVPGDTSGAIPADNGVGFELRWYLAIGTNKGGSSNQNAWGTDATNRHPTGTNIMASTSNDWFVTGVQLEVGDVATAFEHRSFGDELARCERYFEFISSEGDARGFLGPGYCESTSTAAGYILYKTKKRAAPTITRSSTVGDFNFLNTGSSAALSALTFDAITTNACRYSATSSASGFTDAGGGFLTALSTNTCTISIDAEL